jgi:hypothetical protein
MIREKRQRENSRRAITAKSALPSSNLNQRREEWKESDPQ